jgi:D-tagatose-1,6-bisphosphate aldolase subunit GatZ/KbaZ
MTAVDFFSGLVASQKAGAPRGICSICSAHRTVLEAALREGLRTGGPVLIESTANQVNQLGGYTGTTPSDFSGLLRELADAAGFPRDRLFLGGDHLGPWPWRSEPAESAMANARDLVRACVRAGYVKIHLDASMPLGGDRADARGALDPGTAAAREADLAAAAEEARERMPTAGRLLPGPVYVIGTEVPVPGGVSSAASGIEVTDPAELQEAVRLCRAAFLARGLSEPWSRVRAVVAQPGVEFSDDEVHAYRREDAAALCAAARGMPDVVLEGHSTDYQSPRALRELVEDGVAILKVGPALTFALRECLFGLELIERELLPTGRGRRSDHLSGLSAELERAMLAQPAHWNGYYGGNAARARLSRRFSYSDRSRYYWSLPSVRAAVDTLVSNLEASGIPLTLLSQFIPGGYAAVREGRVAPRPPELLRESVRLVLQEYSTATGA